LHRLRRLTVSAHLLTLELTGLGRLHPRPPNLLASRLALDLTRLGRRDTIGASLLALDLASLGRRDAVGANLLTLNSRWSLSGDTGLDSFLACRTSDLLALGAHLHALRTLRPFERYPLSPLHARRSHLPFGAWRLLALLSLLALGLRLLAFGSCGLPVLLWPRIGRGRDRQCGDARGEKYPGHHNFSFLTAKRPEGRTVPALKRMEHAV
jgi:hypothetical protein